MFGSSSALIRSAVVASLCVSAFAHTALNFPNPRAPKQDDAYVNVANRCENTKTEQTEPTVFERGKEFTPSWWWNNHNGGFVKFAITKGFPASVDTDLFLDNGNIIGGQCYTGGCDQNGFDPGFTHLCKGKPMVIPDWVEDGDYTLQFSHIGGFNSLGDPLRALPLYHNCANIKVAGGVTFKPQVKNWVAPFVGGSQDQVGGKPGSADVCAFKKFNAEPADPKLVDTAATGAGDISFGTPAGWAVKGGTNSKREDNLRLPRLAHVARAISLVDDE